MKIKKFWLLLLLLIVGSLNAQEVIIAAGGDTLGSEGSTSFSIGQIFFTNFTDYNISVLTGIQQSIMDIKLGLSDDDNNLSIFIYPNPTTNYLNLTIENIETNMYFKLFNMNGMIIENRKIISKLEIIQMSNLPMGIYIINVFNNSKNSKNY